MNFVLNAGLDAQGVPCDLLEDVRDMGLRSGFLGLCRGIALDILEVYKVPRSFAEKLALTRRSSVELIVERPTREDASVVEVIDSLRREWLLLLCRRLLKLFLDYRRQRLNLISKIYLLPKSFCV